MNKLIEMIEAENARWGMKLKTITFNPERSPLQGWSRKNLAKEIIDRMQRDFPAPCGDLELPNSSIGDILKVAFVLAKKEAGEL